MSTVTICISKIKPTGIYCSNFNKWFNFDNNINPEMKTKILSSNSGDKFVVEIVNNQYIKNIISSEETQATSNVFGNKFKVDENKVEENKIPDIDYKQQLIIRQSSLKTAVEFYAHRGAFLKEIIEAAKYFEEICVHR